MVTPAEVVVPTGTRKKTRAPQGTRPVAGCTPQPDGDDPQQRSDRETWWNTVAFLVTLPWLLWGLTMTELQSTEEWVSMLLLQLVALATSIEQPNWYIRAGWAAGMVAIRRLPLTLLCLKLLLPCPDCHTNEHRSSMLPCRLSSKVQVVLLYLMCQPPSGQAMRKTLLCACAMLACNIACGWCCGMSLLRALAACLLHGLVGSGGPLLLTRIHQPRGADATAEPSSCHSQLSCAPHQPCGADATAEPSSYHSQLSSAPQPRGADATAEPSSCHSQLPCAPHQPRSVQATGQPSDCGPIQAQTATSVAKCPARSPADEFPHALEASSIRDTANELMIIRDTSNERDVAPRHQAARGSSMRTQGTTMQHAAGRTNTEATMPAQWVPGTAICLGAAVRTWAWQKDAGGPRPPDVAGHDHPSVPHRSITAGHAATGAPRRVHLYQSKCCTQLLVSIKVHDHAAYNRRAAITNAATAAVAPTLASWGSHTLRAVAFPGCLQLLLWAPLGGPPHSCPGLQQQQDADLASEIFAAVQPHCQAGTVTVQVNGSLWRFGEAGAAGGLSAAAAVDTQAAASPSGAGSGSGTGVGDGVRVEAGGLVLAPLVLEADGELPAVVEVRLPSSCREAAVQVVVVAESCGESVVVHEVVQAGSRCCRLTLPAHLDVGPLTAHVISAQPGYEGTLLATCHSMVLPLAARQELLDTLPTAPGPSPAPASTTPYPLLAGTGHPTPTPAPAAPQPPPPSPNSPHATPEASTIAGLLHDLALIWQLTRADPGIPTGAPCPEFSSTEPAPCPAATPEANDATPPRRSSVDNGLCGKIQHSVPPSPSKSDAAGSDGQHAGTLQQPLDPSTCGTEAPGCAPQGDLVPALLQPGGCTVGPTVDGVVEGLLHYFGCNDLPACHRLLAHHVHAHLPSNASDGEAAPAAPHASSHPTTAAAAAPVNPGASARLATAPPGAATNATADPTPARPTLLHAATRTTPAATAATAQPRPILSWALTTATATASRVLPVIRPASPCTAAARPPTTACTLALSTCLTFTAAVGLARAHLSQAPFTPALKTIVLLHTLLIVLPYLLPLLHLRSRLPVQRLHAMLLQAGARAGLYLVTASWVPGRAGHLTLPPQAAPCTPTSCWVPVFLVDGLLRPTLNQVPWQLQAVMTSIEEAAKAISCNWQGGNSSCCHSSLVPHLALVLVAALLSYLVHQSSSIPTLATAYWLQRRIISVDAHASTAGCCPPQPTRCTVLEGLEATGEAPQQSKG